ncbi:MAG: hypothetical protein R3D30_10990 [Hyphomicrobiales bacterium]
MATEEKGPDDKRLDENALQEFDPKRRAFLKRLLVGAVFVPPLVSSFSIDRLLISPAHAAGTSFHCVNISSASIKAIVKDKKDCPPGTVPFGPFNL